MDDYNGNSLTGVSMPQQEYFEPPLASHYPGFPSTRPPTFVGQRYSSVAPALTPSLGPANWTPPTRASVPIPPTSGVGRPDATPSTLGDQPIGLATGTNTSVPRSAHPPVLSAHGPPASHIAPETPSSYTPALPPLASPFLQPGYPHTVGQPPTFWPTPTPAVHTTSFLSSTSVTPRPQHAAVQYTYGGPGYGCSGYPPPNLAPPAYPVPHFDAYPVFGRADPGYQYANLGYALNQNTTFGFAHHSNHAFPNQHNPHAASNHHNLAFTQSRPEDAVYNDLLARLTALEEINRDLRLHAASSPNPLPIGYTKRAKAPSMGEPEFFSGEADKLDTFLNQLSLFFASEPPRWTSNHARILYTLGRMRGGQAAAWKDLITASILDQSYPWKTWPSFVEKMRDVFPSRNRRSSATRSIENISMDGRRPVQEFLTKFETFAPLTGFNDLALISIAKKGITRGLLNRMTLKYNVADFETFDQFREAAIDADKNYRETLDEDQFRVTAIDTDRNCGEALDDDRPDTQLDDDSFLETPEPTTPNGTCSDSPQLTPSTSFSTPETDHPVTRTCFNCHEAGHIAAHCVRSTKPNTHTPQQSVISANDHDITNWREYFDEGGRYIPSPTYPT